MSKLSFNKSLLAIMFFAGILAFGGQKAHAGTCDIEIETSELFVWNCAELSSTPGVISVDVDYRFSSPGPLFGWNGLSTIQGTIKACVTQEGGDACADLPDELSFFDDSLGGAFSRSFTSDRLQFWYTGYNSTVRVYLADATFTYGAYKLPFIPCEEQTINLGASEISCSSGALTCGDPGTEDQCEDDGGCGGLEKCVDLNNTGNWTCEMIIGECGVPPQEEYICGEAGTIDTCGAESGCADLGPWYRCEYVGGGGFPYGCVERDAETCYPAEGNECTYSQNNKCGPSDAPDCGAGERCECLGPIDCYCTTDETCEVEPPTGAECDEANEGHCGFIAGCPGVPELSSWICDCGGDGPPCYCTDENYSDLTCPDYEDGVPSCIPFGMGCGGSALLIYSGRDCCNVNGGPQACQEWDDGDTRCGDQSDNIIIGDPFERPTYTGPIVDYNAFIQATVVLLLPVGLIISIPLIALNGYKIMTSQGDPGKIREGKEGLTAAVAGTLFVIMAINLLRIILNSVFNQNF